MRIRKAAASGTSSQDEVPFIGAGSGGAYTYWGGRVRVLEDDTVLGTATGEGGVTSVWYYYPADTEVSADGADNGSSTEGSTPMAAGEYLIAASPRLADDSGPLPADVNPHFTWPDGVVPLAAPAPSAASGPVTVDQPHRYMHISYPGQTLNGQEVLVAPSTTDFAVEEFLLPIAAGGVVTYEFYDDDGGGVQSYPDTTGGFEVYINRVADAAGVPIAPITGYAEATRTDEQFTVDDIASVDVAFTTVGGGSGPGMFLATFSTAGWYLLRADVYA